MSAPILIAGVGNVFLGDDGFGVEVVRRLAARPMPEGVRLGDFGIRGFDLAYALESCRAAILVDATQRGEQPGTLYVLELSAADVEQRLTPDLHAMTPDHVLQFVEAAPSRFFLVGCEPATFGEEGIGALGLSAVVDAAVDRAAETVMQLASELVFESGAHA